MENYGFRVIGWFKEAVQESEGFLRAQYGFHKIDESIQGIMGKHDELRNSTLSSTSCNQLGKTFFDMTAGITDTKPFWEYRTYNKRFEHNCSIYGKLSEHSWINRGMDMEFYYATQYAVAGGTSYFEPYWDTEIEDLKARAWDPRDVLPIRPSNSPSIQDCYGVITRQARSVNHIKYLVKYVFNRPDLVKYVVADRDGSVANNSLRNTRVGSVLAAQGLSPFQQRLFPDKAVKEIPRVPTTDLYTGYIKDDTRNESNQPVFMGNFGEDGQPKNNWSYIVLPGEPLYPRKRMVVFCAGMPEPIYDGPSPWWHGKFPYPKLTLDPVPWSYLGKAPIWDIIPLNKALDKLLRVYDDWCERLARPDAVGDQQAISEHMMNRIDTRRAGKKIRLRPTAGKQGLQFVPPDPLPADFWKGVEYYEQKIKELSGTQDVSNLMRLNQVPSSDSIETIMESMSLTWRMRSRVIEVFMREFAEMQAYNYTQFYNLPLRLTILGGEGVTLQDYDFDPDSLVPDFVHSSDFDMETNMPTIEAMDRGPLPRYDRAREFLRQFSFHIAPGSLLASSELQRKLMYLQLSRAGLIDHWTLLDVLGIPNVGNPPMGVNTITERLMAEMQMGLGMQVSPTGRKASGQESPRLTVKES